MPTRTAAPLQASHREEIGSHRTEAATRFGAVDTQIEAVKTMIERYTRLVMVGGLTFLATLAAMFGTMGHALKWF